jgi:hypothetical protein
MLKEIAIFLIFLGMIFTAIGGILDMTNKDNLLISKKHFWNDGTYLTILAVALLLLDKK